MVPQKMPMSSLPAEKSTRDLILEQAGATQEQLANMLRQALEVATQKLYAKTTKIISHQGQVTDEVHLDDNKTQLEAAKFLSEFAIKVAGLGAKSESGPKQSPQVIVNIPPQAEMRKATPTKIEVADEDYI